MVSPDLVRRMKDFFARQAACCDEAYRDLEALPLDADDEALDRLSECQRAHGARVQALAAEYARLEAEWAAAKPTEAQRAELRPDAHRAGEAAARLAGLNEKRKAWTDAKMVELAGQLAGLQRGRDVMNRYDVPDSGASFIDTKA